MRRSERARWNQLIEDLRGCPDHLAQRLRPPRWWERPCVVRAIASFAPCGAVKVFAEFPPVRREPIGGALRHEPR